MLIWARQDFEVLDCVNDWILSQFRYHCNSTKIWYDIILYCVISRKNSIEKIALWSQFCNTYNLNLNKK